MSFSARHAGQVKGGQLVLRDPVAWRAAVARHEGKDVFVTVTRQQHVRSMEANRYYWGVVVSEIAAYIGEGRDETHDLLKAKFLPGRSVELLDGRSLEMPPTTRLLTVEQFAAYIESIRVWAAQFLGLSIPDSSQVEATL